MLTIQGQRVSVNATVQPSEILIGEQALINLQVIAPKDKEILFPVYTDSIVGGLKFYRWVIQILLLPIMYEPSI